ncbi:MAG: hypothetical protein IT337_01740 [Thermomicrobiales bacterium]|nr:hypothetical protein [Thermomicrobiales bacterium]
MSAVRASAMRIELSANARFTGRVRRLAGVAAVALGVVWWLAATDAAAPRWAATALLMGWWSMTPLLMMSLLRPSLRLLLVVPSTLVTLGLLGMLPGAFAAGELAAVGWASLFAGIVLGDLLGLWFWLRLAPVPAALEHPFSRGRWALIVVHVACILVGIALAALG